MADAPTATKPPRRWLRFSLRTLLVFMLLASIGLAWLGNTLLRVRKQRAIVTQIEAAGGRVFYDYQVGWTAKPRDPPGPKFLRYLLGDDSFAQVVWVDTWGSLGSTTSGEDSDLERLAGLPELNSLSLHSAGFTDEGIPHILNLVSLRQLALHDTRITNGGLERLSAHQSLSGLRLYGATVTDETMLGVGQLSKLERLTLRRTSVTSDGIKVVGNLAQLRELKIYEGPAIGDDGMEHLKGLTELESFESIKTGISDRGLASLQGNQRLSVLRLDSCAITDEGLMSLDAFPNLRMLSVQRNKLSDEGIAHLRGLDLLEQLFLDGTSVTDAGLVTIARLENLKLLSVHSTPLTDEGIVHLRTLKHLEHLSVGPNVTLAGAQKLKASLPNCRISGYGHTGAGVFNVP
jgi:internalin A